MKKDFLNALANQDDPLTQWPGAQLVVFGSTLMLQLQREGVQMPLTKRKSSDIDLGIWLPHKVSRDEMNAKYEKYVAPMLRKAVKESGLDVIGLRGDHAVANAQIGEQDKLPDSFFADHFLVTRDFTAGQIHETLRSRHDYEQLKDSIPREGLKVPLYISSSPLPPPLIIDPSPFFHGPWNHEKGAHEHEDGQPVHRENAIVLKRSNRVNMLADKLRKNIVRQDFKPTDLMDVYNLIKAQTPDGKPLMDLDPASPTNVLEDIRVALIATMATFDVKIMSADKRSVREDLLRPFEYTPENARRFHEIADNQIASNVPVTDDELKEMYRSINELMDKIKNLRREKEADDGRYQDGKVYGPLNFTKNDLDFLASPEGYIYKPGLQGTTTISPRIAIDKLETEYPATFEKYPTLSANIVKYHKLNERVEANKHEAATARESFVGVG